MYFTKAEHADLMQTIRQQPCDPLALLRLSAYNCPGILLESVVQGCGDGNDETCPDMQQEGNVHYFMIGRQTPLSARQKFILILLISSAFWHSQALGANQSCREVLNGFCVRPHLSHTFRKHHEQEARDCGYAQLQISLDSVNDTSIGHPRLLTVTAFATSTLL